MLVRLHLTERILYYTGVNYKIGDTWRRYCNNGLMNRSRKRGITITSAATTCHCDIEEKTKSGNRRFRASYQYQHTPGHVDFTERRASTRVYSDGAVGVFLKARVVLSRSQKRMASGQTHTTCSRMAFINKMDILGAGFLQCCRIRSR